VNSPHTVTAPCPNPLELPVFSRIFSPFLFLAGFRNHEDMQAIIAENTFFLVWNFMQIHSKFSSIGRIMWNVNVI